jgi:hypothetical protein
MLGIDQQQSFAYATFRQAALNVGGDVDKGPSGGYVEPEFFAVTFHSTISLIGICFTETSIGFLLSVKP